MKKLLIGGLIVVFVVLAYPFARKALMSAAKPTSRPVQEQPEEQTIRKIITLAQFNEIQTGMRYEEVVRILGKEGAIEGEQTESDDFGHKVVLRQYSWKNGSFGGFMDVTFANGAVATKTQYGLN